MELRALTASSTRSSRNSRASCTRKSAGFMPLEEEAAAFIEIVLIAINELTDALKSTTCRPGMQIVERAYGMLELHDKDKGTAAIDTIVGRMGVKREDRLKPKIISSQIITGIDGHQRQFINRMRHGRGQIMQYCPYLLEVHPAAYAAIAANEAEKAAPIHLLEVITFGAFGRISSGAG